jgi:hypothetical protein
LIRDQHDEIKRRFSKVETDRRDALECLLRPWLCMRPPKKA